jgi:NDP-sugar pyrophosphorylase family protein
MGNHAKPLSVNAAILAGGLGMRLRPALKDCPKVLARVGERPFISILLAKLAAAGVETTVLLAGYRAAQLRRTVGANYGGMELAYSVEASPLGTAGALRQALPKLETETLLLLNGDSFCDVDLSSLVAEHRRRQAELTLTLTHVADASRFGEVKVAPDGKVIHFGEKQARGGEPGLINAGVYVLARSLIADIPAGQACSLERDMLPIWIRGRRLQGFKGARRFLDIGTPSSYAGAAAFFQGCRA